MTKLHLAYCSGEAAKFACSNWHYSRKLPSFKTARFGVWEDENFIGAVVFSHPLPPLRKTFGVQKMRIVELSRVALAEHKTPVSRILAVALRLLFETNPKIELVISFADTEQGHHGGVYQAGGWLYTGAQSSGPRYRDGLKPMHSRVYHQMRREQKNTDHIVRYEGSVKHRYVKFGPAASSGLEGRVKQMLKSYPKRTKPSSEASGFRSVEGGAIPTRALQSSQVVANG